MAYAVAQRTRELGIRMLSAPEPVRWSRSWMRSGLKLVLIGLGIGAVCSIGAGYLIASQLYDVSRSIPPYSRSSRSPCSQRRQLPVGYRQEKPPG